MQYIYLQVTGISYDKDETGKVTVTTANGDDHVADYVLISLPLSLLKRQAIQFTPSLPDWKLQAVNKLGVGLLEKVSILQNKLN
jgi:monoamine oxidase